MALRESLGKVTPEHTPTLSKSVTPHPQLPYQKLQTWPASPPVHSVKHPRHNPTCLSDEMLQLQGEMNAALEWLLTIKATLNSHQRELAWNAEIAMHQNEVQTTEAIKETDL